MSDNIITPPAPTPAPAPVAVTIPELPDNWHSALPDDLKNEESVKLFRDVPSLVKSLVAAQKMVGVDKIAIPNAKYATDEEYQKVYQKLGLPEKFEDYKVEAPKDLGFADDRMKEYKEAAFKAGITPRQLQKMLDWHEADTKKVLSSSQEKVNQDLEGAKAALKQEWGAAHDKKLATAKFAIKTLNDPKLVEFLEKTRLGDHPDMVKVFARVGEMLGEKQVEGLGAETGQFGNVKTPDVAKREIATIQGNMEHPYHNSKHPAHNQAVEDMQALFQMAFPHVEERAI